MPLKPIQIDNFKGGWSSNEETTIDDNQLAEAKNMFYDKNNLLRSRFGSEVFGEPIPDSSIIVLSMNTFDGNGTWAGTDDAINLATQTSGNKRGPGAVEFDIDVSASVNPFATITTDPLSSSIDLSSANQTGTLRMWVYFPDTVANITAVNFTWGSSSSDYYSLDASTQIDGSAFAAATWMLLSFNWASASTTGTPDDAAIDYLRIIVKYSGSQADMDNVLVDQISWSSATQGVAVSAINAFEQSTGTIFLTAHCGSVYYNYNENVGYWDVLVTGLRDALVDDLVVKGNAQVFKDIQYYVNGVDYISFDGVLAAQESTPQKVRYLLVVNDIVYGLARQGAASSLHYNAKPASLKISFGTTVPIDEDNGQVGTGLGNIGDFVYVIKERSAYKFNVSDDSYGQIDDRVGTNSHNSIVNVSNNVLLQGQDGNIYNLLVQEGGGQRTKATALSDHLKTYTSTLDNLNTTASIHWRQKNNAYFAVDPGNTGTPTEIIVLNTKLSSLEQNKGVFTRYVGINANDFTIFEDSNGVEHLLVANGFGGQVMDMETGVDDDGTEIAIDVKTKAYEFGEPTIPKIIGDIDAIFFATDGATFQYDALGDDGNIGGAEVSVESESSNASALAISPIGTQVLGGANVDTLRRFKRRLPIYTVTDKVQVRLSELLLSHTLILEKITFTARQLGRNVFPTNSVL